MLGRASLDATPVACFLGFGSLVVFGSVEHMVVLGVDIDIGIGDNIEEVVDGVE